MKLFPRALCLGAGLLAGSALRAQTEGARPWQHLGLPTVAQVQANWTVPPPEYGPEPYYGMNGPITLETVRQDFDTMKSLGFRAVTIQYGFGSDRAYLSDEHLHFFREVVLEAKKRGMGVWIVDDAGYPSGFAGGKFTSEHPELRMQALVLLSRTQLNPGEHFHEAVSPDAVAVTALSGDGRSVAVPVLDGGVDWKAPDGTAGNSWTINVIGHTFRTSPTRSDTNPKRVKDGSQSLEDYLDPAATEQFLAFTHEAYKRVVGDEFGKTILGFRGDEPDYSISGLPWTPKFFAAFESRKGYNIRPFVAAFLQPKGAALTQEQMRARADYFDVFADLFRDGFFKPQAQWCAANGMEYQVHLNHEEQQIALARSEGSFFRDMRFVQVPGIDTIWHQIWTDTISDFPRLASSAAHVYGHPRAFTESFAAYRPLPDVVMARYILNEQIARGVNLVEAMYFPASSTEGHGGPMPFMQDPGFPDLMRYVSRLSYLMSSGRPDASVALLLPSEALWMGDTKADDTFVSAERMLSEHQVEFDVVDDDALASLLPVEDGAFVSKSGNRYRTVIVPPAELLPEAVVERLRLFAKQRGHVLFLGGTPAYVAQKSDLHARAATPDEFAWAQVAHGDLAPTPTPPMQPPSGPPEAQVVPPGLLSAVQAAVPPQLLRLSTPDTALRVAHRVLRDGDLYLLFNESAKPFQDEIKLQTKVRRAERWNADTGQIQAARAVRRGSDGLTMSVSCRRMGQKFWCCGRQEGTELRYLWLIGLCCGASLQAQTWTCGKTSQAGATTALTQESKYSPSAAGWDLGMAPESVDAAGCRSSKSFFFSVPEAEGNYIVMVELGGPARARTTVKAESRRVMLAAVETGPRANKAESFAVNVRRPEIEGGGPVKLKPREVGALDWDNKLTLEFAGDEPSIRSITVKPAPEHTPVLYLAGDSTVVDQDKEPWAAWGQMLPAFFGPGLVIANHAESGETIRSFEGEQRFAKIVPLLKKGDYLMLQFAHNDQKPGNGYVSPEMYADLLRKYIGLARERGATPILVTSMNRRTFDEQGNITDTLAPYPQTMRDVATEEKLELIDLNAMSKTLYESVGEPHSRSLFVYAAANTYPGQTEALHDDTHFNAYGAWELARCVVLGLQQDRSPLVSLLRRPNGRFDPRHPDAPETVALPPTPLVDAEKPYER